LKVGLLCEGEFNNNNRGACEPIAQHPKPISDTFHPILEKFLYCILILYIENFFYTTNHFSWVFLINPNFV